MSTPLVLVVMGVSGAGKSVVGAALAERLDVAFEDGDVLHPAANIAKMAAGIPLTDADRAPWLDQVAAQIAAWRAEKRGGVIACSALKRAYRDRFSAPGVRFIYLAETLDEVRARLAHRRGHFMPPSLVASQFAALEVPGPDEAVLVSPPAETPQARCEAILQVLRAD